MLVTLSTADKRPPAAAIYRAHEVLALCLEHAEQLPCATRFLFSTCHVLAVFQSYLKLPKPNVEPLSQAQQAQRHTAGALLLVREGLDWLAKFGNGAA